MAERVLRYLAVLEGPGVTKTHSSFPVSFLKSVGCWPFFFFNKEPSVSVKQFKTIMTLDFFFLCSVGGTLPASMFHSFKLLCIMNGFVKITCSHKSLYFVYNGISECK